MLPLPVSLTSSRHPRSRHYRSTRDILLTRARITNLGFFLLAGFAAFSFLLNLVWYLAGSDDHAYDHEGPYAAPRGIWETLQRDPALEGIDHLIMVPGHAIWKGTNLEARLDEDQWVLEPYQRGGGRVSAFFRHIVAGYVVYALHAYSLLTPCSAELARDDEHSLLVFSG